jgi:hypothetical protein
MMRAKRTLNPADRAIRDIASLIHIALELIQLRAGGGRRGRWTSVIP